MNHAIQRFFTDRHGRVVIAQWPNLPLVAWAVLGIAARFGGDRWAPLLHFLSGAALVTWAYLEATHGDSPFRRVLGAAVLAWMVVSRWPE